MSLSSEMLSFVDGRDAGCAFLVRFEFASGPKRVWTGFGKLQTLDGLEWDGIGELGRIEGLDSAANGVASPGSFVLSGVSADMIAAVIDDVDDYLNRPVMVYLQAFQNRALYQLPLPLALRFMGSAEITRDADTRAITVPHEGVYTGRNRPPAGWYSDRDQQKRFPGDLMCERAYQLLFKQDGWPSY